jgi:hypothetical protein
VAIIAAAAYAGVAAVKAGDSFMPHNLGPRALPGTSAPLAFAAGPRWLPSLCSIGLGISPGINDLSHLLVPWAKVPKPENFISYEKRGTDR